MGLFSDKLTSGCNGQNQEGSCCWNPQFFLVNSELPWTAQSVLVECPLCFLSLNKLWLLGDISILDRRNHQLSSVLNQFLILNRSSRSYMANLRQNAKLFGWCFPIPLNPLNDPKYVISSPTSTMVSGGCLILRRRNDRFFSLKWQNFNPLMDQTLPKTCQGRQEPMQSWYGDRHSRLVNPPAERAPVRYPKLLQIAPISLGLMEDVLN